MKNYRTTIFGALTALGAFFAQSSTGVLQVVGQGVQVLGTLLLGASAHDAVNKPQ